MQCRMALSKCRSNFTGRLAAFFSHSPAPAGEKFRTVQSKKVPLPKAILPTIRIWCLGTILRSPHSYGRRGGGGRQGGAQSRTGGMVGSGGKIGSLGFLSRGHL